MQNHVSTRLVEIQQVNEKQIRQILSTCYAGTVSTQKIRTSSVVSDNFPALISFHINCTHSANFCHKDFNSYLDQSDSRSCSTCIKIHTLK